MKNNLTSVEGTMKTQTSPSTSPSKAGWGKMKSDMASVEEAGRTMKMQQAMRATDTYLTHI